MRVGDIDDLIGSKLACCRTGEPGGEFFLFEEVRPEGEAIHVGGQEAFDRFAGMADGGLAADVKGGIDEHGAAGAVGEGREQAVQRGIHGAIDRLDTGRAIDVRDGRNDGACDAQPRRSRLHGIPIGIKDIFDTFDMPTTYGSTIYKDFQPTMDTALVGLMRRAGMVILGKCRTTEFASPVPVGVRNPHDFARSPGVSSSGSAVFWATRRCRPRTGVSDRDGLLHLPQFLLSVVR